MAARSYQDLASDSDGEETTTDAGDEKGGKCCKVFGSCMASLLTFLANFTHSPKKADFVSFGNFKCARCIWIMLLVFFIGTVMLQMQLWFGLGVRPPLVTSQGKNFFYFAPNIEFCNDNVHALAIEIESVQVFELKTQKRVPLVDGIDFFVATDCEKAAILCDKEPPVLCPIPAEFWPLDPKSGLRVRAGHPLNPLGDCFHAENPCTRLFVKPSSTTKLALNDETGVSTELQVIVKRGVNPQQWFFGSGISPGRCLASQGNNLELGGDCDDYAATDDLRAMFQYYAKSGETGMIKERGGYCVQAEKPNYDYAMLTPCEFGGGIRFQQKTGRLYQEGSSPSMCVTEGEGHPAEEIKIHWGSEDLTAFKVFWEACGDRSNDPELFARQTWMFDSETGFITSSIALPLQRPEAYCLMMSDHKDHWSGDTKLLVLMPCSLMSPEPHEADMWWKDANAALASAGASAGGGPPKVWLETSKMKEKSTDSESTLRKRTHSKSCTVESQVTTGKKYTGTSKLTCLQDTTSCFKDCGTCAPMCKYLDWLGDGNCNDDCNNEACNFDCNAEACDCDAMAAGETTVPSAERVANFRKKVLATFTDCKETCDTFQKSHTSYLRYRWEPYGTANEIGSLVRLTDDYPNEGCEDKATGKKGCYARVYEAFAGKAPPAGEAGKWCLSSYSGSDPLPMTWNAAQAVLPVRMAPVVQPTVASLHECFPQRNAQRFFYERNTGHIRGKSGRCMTLNSEVTCRSIMALGKPMKALETLPLPGTFGSLEECGKEVHKLKMTEFEFRVAMGATYTSSTQACAANLGHTKTAAFPTGEELCHFDTVDPNPAVAFAACDMSDPRQSWMVTPQSIFAPTVSFVPPQTRTVPQNFRLYFRVLYDKSGLKKVVDHFAKAFHPPWGYTGFWLQRMPLELMMPGEKVWDGAVHTKTSRNQMYRIAVDVEGHGSKDFFTLGMPWSLTDEQMHMKVHRSDLIITKDPVESLRIERVYLNVGYDSNVIVHKIKTSDMITTFTTMLAVIAATAGLMKCWQSVFPMVGKSYMTFHGGAMTHLKDELDKYDISTDDVYEHVGVDIPYYIEQERKPCCPCFFSQPDDDDDHHE